MQYNGPLNKPLLVDCAESRSIRAERKELWGRRNTERSSPTITGPGQPKQFAADTAEKTGTSKHTVNQAIARAENIPNSIMAMVKGRHFDNPSSLI